MICPCFVNVAFGCDAVAIPMAESAEEFSLGNPQYTTTIVPSAEIAAPGFYSSPSTVTGPKLEHLLQLESTLNTTFERWAELEDMVG